MSSSSAMCTVAQFWRNSPGETSDPRHKADVSVGQELSMVQIISSLFLDNFGIILEPDDSLNR
eukprot:scaffold1066_cov16-Tisochrysis_lutea.AAC.2